MRLAKQFLMQSIVVLTLAAIALLAGCTIIDPAEGIVVKIKNIPRTTMIRVEFNDIATGKVITDPVTISFSGKDKNKVISQGNKPVSTVTVTGGVYNFAIADSVIPSDGSPVEFIVVAKAGNYLSTSVTLRLARPGSHSFAVNLLHTAASVNGVNANAIENAGTASLASGTTTRITAGVAAGPSGPGASLIIPQGTLLKDKDGNVLSGTVSARVTCFDATVQSALAAFPGGFAIRDEQGRNGHFITAGFAALDLTVNGTEVKTFSKNVTVEIGINPGTINPETGTTVKPGDLIPLWSYDKENGTWKNEGTYAVTAASQAGNALSIRKADVRHFSWYNMDWHYGGCNSSNMVIAITGSGWQSLVVSAQFVQGSGFLYDGWQVFKEDSLLKLFNAPTGRPVRFKAFMNYDDYMLYKRVPTTDYSVGTIVINELCVGAADTVLLPVTPRQQSADTIRLHLTATCPNGLVLSEGTINLEILKDNRWELAGTIRNGDITINNLMIGKTYAFRVWYNQQYYQAELRITAKEQDINIQLPADCDLCRQ